FMGQDGSFTALAVGGDNKLLATGDAEGRVRLWNPDNGQETGRIGAGGEGIHAVSLLAAGKGVVSTSQKGTVALWRLPLVPPRLLVHGDQVTGVAVTADGKKAVTGCGDRTVRVWNVATGTREHELTGLTLRALSVAVSGDGKLVAAGGADKLLLIWNAADGKVLHKLTLDAAPGALAFTPDG